MYLGPVDLAEPGECTQPGAAHERNKAEIKSGWGGRRRNAGRPKTRPIAPSQRRYGPRWWVLQMYAGVEARTIRDLAQGETKRWLPPRAPFQVELPMTLTMRMMRGKRVSVQVPMLSGYGFVFLDLDVDDVSALRRFDGVTGTGVDGVRILMRSEPVPVGVVEEWIRDAPSRLHLRGAPLEKFLPSQALIYDLAGEEMRAVCVSCDGLTTRARMGMFGREIEVTMPREKFRAAG